MKLFPIFKILFNSLVKIYIIGVPIIYVIIFFQCCFFFYKKNIKYDEIKNFYNISIVTLYISFIISVFIGLFCNLLNIKNTIFIYINKNFEFFNFNLDCFKLFFIIIANMIILFALISFKNQNLDRSFYKIKKNFFYSKKNTNNVAIESYNYFFLFISFIFILQFIIHFMFITENLFIFFICFEFSVIPIFCIIGFFGKRSIKFKAMNYIIYFTFISAIPFIIAIMFIWNKVGSLYYPTIKFFFINNSENIISLIVLFICFFIPFAVKLAIFPFHTWLPEAHVEASTEGSIILSGIMLKLGFYGICKFCIGFFSVVIPYVAPYIFVICLVGASTTSFSMYKQIDVKKIIAYSSVVHMNIAIFGFFSGSQTAIQGAIFFSYSHGLASAGLFCAIGYVHDKIKTRNLLEISGLSVFMPNWSFTFFIFILTNAGMPLTVGFISEFSLICGLFEFFPVTSVILLFIPISLSAYRNYLLYTQICFGVPSTYLGSYKIKDIKTKNFNKYKIFIVKNWDINFSGEGIILYTICFFSVFHGIIPKYFITLTEWTSIFQEIQTLLIKNSNLFV